MTLIGGYPRLGVGLQKLMDVQELLSMLSSSQTLTLQLQRAQAFGPMGILDLASSSIYFSM